MTCAVHAERDAVAFCRTCGKALCGECRRDVRGVIYCETCLARDLAAGPAAAPAPAVTAPGAPLPGVALALGFIPGVGAIYNGQYAKAFVHVVIFGVLISIMDSGAARGFEPLFGMFLAAFYFYMPIEAYHTAKKRAAGLAVDEWSGLISTGGFGRSSGALVLIGLGIVFLLSNLELIQMRQVMKYWPLLLIGVGLAMLVQRMGGPKSGPPPEG